MGPGFMNQEHFRILIILCRVFWRWTIMHQFTDWRYEAAVARRAGLLYGPITQLLWSCIFQLLCFFGPPFSDPPFSANSRVMIQHGNTENPHVCLSLSYAPLFRYMNVTQNCCPCDRNKWERAETNWRSFVLRNGAFVGLYITTDFLSSEFALVFAY